MKKLFGQGAHHSKFGELIRRKQPIVDPVQFEPKWKVAKNLPRRNFRWCGFATLDDEHIILAGGQDENYNTSNAVTLVNLKTGKCTELPPMIKARYECSAIVVNRILFIFGGHNRDGSLKHVEMLDLSDFVSPVSSSSSQRQFVLLKNHPLPQPLLNATLVADNGGNFIYVIGGALVVNNGRPLNTVYRFNVATYEWFTLPSMQVERQGAMALLWKEYLIVLGGYYCYRDRGDVYFSSIETLRLRDNPQDKENEHQSSSWKLVDKANFLPEARADGFAFLLGDGQLIVAGGKGSDGKLLKTCCHHGNIDSLLFSNKDAAEEGCFTTHSFPRFPVPSKYFLRSMAVTPTCLAFVSFHSELYLLGMESNLDLVSTTNTTTHDDDDDHIGKTTTTTNPKHSIHQQQQLLLQYDQDHPNPIAYDRKI